MSSSLMDQLLLWSGMNVIIICLGGERLLFGHFEVILNLSQFPLAEVGPKHVKILFVPSCPSIDNGLQQSNMIRI